MTSRRFYGKKWLISIGFACLLLLYAVPRGQAVGKGGGGGPNSGNGGGTASQLLGVYAGASSATANVTLCSDTTCGGHKTFACSTLEVQSNLLVAEPCTNGGGWKGFSYDVTVYRMDGTSFECSGIDVIGATDKCNDPTDPTGASGVAAEVGAF